MLSLSDLAALLGVGSSELQGLAAMPYRHFPMAKRDGTTRPIGEPAPELKEAQRVLLDAFWSGFRVHDATHSVTGRSALTNASRHAGATALLKLDIRGFFPSIQAPRIVGFLVSAGVPRDVSEALASLATWEGSLPQGAPTSNAIADVLCYRLDTRLAGVAAKFDATYTRYVDDITFSWRVAEVPFVAARETAHTVLRAEGFHVNARKTRMVRHGGHMMVTGYNVEGDRPRASGNVRRKLRAAEFNASRGRGNRESLVSLRAYVAAAGEST